MTLLNQFKLEGKGEAIFDIPYMIKIHAENMKNNVGALWDLSAKKLSQSSPICNLNENESDRQILNIFFIFLA